MSRFCMVSVKLCSRAVSEPMRVLVRRRMGLGPRLIASPQYRAARMRRLNLGATLPLGEQQQAPHTKGRERQLSLGNRLCCSRKLTC